MIIQKESLPKQLAGLVVFFGLLAIIYLKLKYNL